MSHTPESWTAHGNGMITDARGVVVAVFDDKSLPANRESSDVVWQRGLLAAAAPDLLAALEAAVEACGKANACASLPDHTRELCREASKNGRAAIAKARGAK